MTKMIIPASLFLLSGLGTARADVAVSASLVVEPPVPVPAIVPPAPVLVPPAVPVAHYVARPVVASPAVTGGQWVYTSQYGWIYQPYGDQYVYSYASSPYAYVYYPAFGWRWLASPWVIGRGPYPYFGVHGPFAYGWYRGLAHAGHPWGPYYAHVHGRPLVGPRGAVHGRPAYGARGPAAPAPSRPAFAPRASTPARPAMVAQRSVGATRGPVAARAGFAGGRAVGRR